MCDSGFPTDPLILVPAPNSFFGHFQKRKLKNFILVKISFKSDKNWGSYSQFNIQILLIKLKI